MCLCINSSDVLSRFHSKIIHQLVHPAPLGNSVATSCFEVKASDSNCLLLEHEGLQAAVALNGFPIAGSIVTPATQTI